MYVQKPSPPASECVDFRNGQPSADMLPLDMIGTAAAARVAEGNPLVLQYGTDVGYPGFRQAVAAMVARHTHTPPSDVHADDIIVTNGCTSGLALVASLVASPGNVAVVEDPTYFLALSVLRDARLTVAAVPSAGRAGFDVDALAALLATGVRPALVYVVPVHGNPSGVTMPPEQQAALVELAETYGFLVVADEVYQALSFPGAPSPPPPPMSTLGSDRVVSLGSFSKIAAPGLRLGWLHTTNADVRRRVATCGLIDSGGGMAPFVSAVVHAAIDSGTQDAHIHAVRAELAARCAALCDALDDEGLTGYHRPRGGYFTWLPLPGGMTADDVVSAGTSAGAGVRVLRGSLCSAVDSAHSRRHVRLSFSHYTAPELVTGVRRLAAVIRSVRR